MTDIFIKPALPNLIVRDPVTYEPLPPEGARKPDNIYWRRRLAEESVVLIEEPNEATT